ncbi:MULTISPECIES: 23S rRNA (cytidine(2498)-2'-O)-methyltransferase RlmM [Pseudomonas syringae group]|uniref:23S rRNA (cytidine(2498)-2'-O)-methyltransferase RlmM n=1 Tax=Pseudomonas syringae group TaxID=136849 RepID=UPI000F02FA1D|nr:23S rRNA (cytidine(2498)-2'-O)-methyltransferase RlmM [Pseudomonas viridiflava]MCF9017463.1 23S rRNA (cytidine(2498)-2'-O)-methyltransferase RlmM [Pseudomonas syringae]MBI6683701.1 23S rRNA (cytidine(2498)-2'-O)-methyltransferase RlmM [Pseudomonas viridiflava]MEE4070184.1 23S rRNA (cytidine(2498)-2'-O)-methyltransferase RlmM [Pseudomonas viridiflava]MEE4156825.1 23S rRNA (cytidine(2498)-2'-O)-methyltransferase RlmM [Pseudomonas viridiflava]QXG26212.1 23S rRNA (cytidine(2498)-2'-O)-methyltra
MNTLFMHCRPGFESEVCSEIADHAARLEVAGYAKARPNTACAEFICSEPDGAERLMSGQRFDQLIFPRQWARGVFLDLPETDRISVILGQMADFPVCGSLWLEVVDTNDGKELSNFCKKFEAPLRKALNQAGKLIDDPRKPRLLLTFKSGREVFLGLADAGNSAMWPMGIPRLKFPREAPSRSTLKLEEAWHHFIPRDQWDERLSGDMTGVDLGAAPGGWTYQLVRRGMLVTAIDNGPMAESLMDTGLVQHLMADGFTYKPRQPVDWMVCDIVEKPARNAALLETWLGEGLCREAVVNLKLPMKQRYAEVRRLLDRIEEGFKERGIRVSIGCKQLYHDREEVTCHLRRLDVAKTARPRKG